MTRNCIIITTVGTSDFALPDEILTLIGEACFKELGSRDGKPVTLDDPLEFARKSKELSEIGNKARIWGNHFRDMEDAKKEAHIRNNRGKLFPILQQTLRQAEDEFEEGEGRKRIIENIKGIYLICTNTTEQYAAGLEEKDSVYYAEFIQKYLKQVLSSLRDTEIYEPIRLESDPRFYDQMYREILGHLREIKPEIKPDERIYLLPAAGTPAMSSALIAAGVRVFQEKAQVIYQAEQVVPQPLGIGKILLAQQVIDNIEQLITRFDYSGALSLLEKNNELLKPKNQTATFEALQALLQHAQARLLFDFEDADQCLEEYLKFQNDVSGIRGYYLASANTTDLNEQLKFGFGAIAELYWNVNLQWEADRYADYLVRLKTLTDRIALFALELLIGIPFSFEEAQHNQVALDRLNFNNLSGGLKAAFDRNTAIHSYIKRKFRDRYGNGIIRFGKETDAAGDIASTLCAAGYQATRENTESVKKLLNLIIYEEGDNGSGIRVCLNGSTAIYNLTKLRNSLPPAHSFGKIGSELIMDAVRSGGWADNAPHLTIGEALGKLACWSEFSPKLQVSEHREDSPFYHISVRLLKLLGLLEKSF